MTTVVNLRRGHQYHIFIGRGSPWGNPFHIGRDGTRAEVIEKYRQWLLGQPELLAQLLTLRVERWVVIANLRPAMGTYLRRWPMLVRELIRALRKMPRDLEVLTLDSSPDFDYDTPIGPPLVTRVKFDPDWNAYQDAMGYTPGGPLESEAVVI